MNDCIINLQQQLTECFQKHLGTFSIISSDKNDKTSHVSVRLRKSVKYEETTKQVKGENITKLIKKYEKNVN